MRDLFLWNPSKISDILPRTRTRELGYGDGGPGPSGENVKILFGTRASMNRTEQKNESFYRALTRNMVLIVIVVSFTPLILISGIIGYQFHTSYHETVLARLKELVLKHKQNIDSFLYERLSNIQITARTYTIPQLHNEAFLQERFSVLRDEYGGVFVDLGLVDERGSR